MIQKTAFGPQSVIIPQHLLMHLSVSHWQCEGLSHSWQKHISGCTHTPAYTSTISNTHMQCMHSWNTFTEHAGICPWQNNRGVKCEVCIRHVSALSACEAAVKEEFEMARRHRMAVQADFAKSCLSPNYHLRLQHRRYLSDSQQPPHPLKMSRAAESILNGRHKTCRPHTPRTGNLKDFINSVYYFISLEQNKEHTVHNGI